MNRILLVDDNVELRSLLTLVLSSSTCSVDEAESGHEALQRFYSDEYELVITDYDMTGMNGAELTQELRKVSPDCPIIGISASPYAWEFADAGATEFLSKPFKMTDIKCLVQRYLAG